MRKTAAGLLHLLVLCAPAGASSITVAYSGGANFSFTPVAGSLSPSTGACVTPPTLIQNCSNASAQFSSANFTGQATASAPANLSQPPVLSANVSMVSSADGTYSAVATSALQVAPSTAVSNAYLFPSLVINFTGGFYGSVSIDAEQRAVSPAGFWLPPFVLDIFLSGPSPFSFVLDPATNQMSLAVGPGDSGGISGLEAGLDYEFQNGIVTVSSNSLGLALPPVGSAAGFSLNSVAPFEGTYPALGPENTVFTDEVSASATLIGIPEPGTFFVSFAALGFLLHRARLLKS